MLAYQNGISDAFDTLYSRFAGRVYSYLSRRLQQKNEVDDVYQNVFLKLHQSKHLYDAKLLFAPWLFTICRTSLLDFLKRKHPEISLESESLEKFPSRAEGPEKGFGSELLNSLPEKQKNIIHMRYAEDLDFEEIAKRVHSTPVNVRKIISRALKTLRKNHE